MMRCGRCDDRFACAFGGLIIDGTTIPRWLCTNRKYVMLLNDLRLRSLTCVLLTSFTTLFVSWRNNNGDDDCATRWMEKPMRHYYLGANKYQNVSYHLFDFEVVSCYLCSFTIYIILILLDRISCGHNLILISCLYGKIWNWGVWILMKRYFWFCSNK